MSNLFNFNNYNLSKDEIINYADNGTIDELKSQVSGRSYDEGYDHGWSSAVEDMQRHLNGM